jgi:hypothetical protein
VIEDNLFYDIVSRRDLGANGRSPETNGVRGIYLDDFVSGITIRNNIFYNVEYAIFINGGSDVTVDSNIFIRSHPPLLFYAWGLAHPPSAFNEKHRAVAILRELAAKGSLVFERYPRLREPIERLLIPRGDRWTNNILVDSSPPQVYNEKKSGGLMDLSGAHILTMPSVDYIEDPAAMRQSKSEIRSRVHSLLQHKYP